MVSIIAYMVKLIQINQFRIHSMYRWMSQTQKLDAPWRRRWNRPRSSRQCSARTNRPVSIKKTKLMEQFWLEIIDWRIYRSEVDHPDEETDQAHDADDDPALPPGEIVADDGHHRRCQRHRAAYTKRCQHQEEQHCKELYDRTFYD